MDKLFAARNAQLERIRSRSNVACMLEEVPAFLWKLRTAQPRVESIPKGLSMSESVATDSILRQSKRRPYSNDLGPSNRSDRRRVRASRGGGPVVTEIAPCR